MISYPGEVLRRFGRYEAVEDLGSTARASLWGAWDPFLERFVIVVDLSALGAEDLLDGMRTVGSALERWTDNKLTDSDVVLDFSPGGLAEPPYLVVANAAAEPDVDPVGAAADPPEERHAEAQQVAQREPATLHVALPASRAAAMRNAPLLAGVAVVAMLGGGAAGYFFRAEPSTSVAPPERAEPRSGSAPGERVAVAAPSATPTGTAIATPTSAETPTSLEAGDTPMPAATITVTATRPTVTATTAPRDTATTTGAAELRLAPAPGAVTLAPGAVTEFAVRGGASDASAYEWRLDARVVGRGRAYRLTAADVAGTGPRLLQVSDASDGELGRWTVSVRDASGRGSVQLAPSTAQVAPGDTLRVAARFSGVANPAKLQCTWAVDGAGATHVCEQLEYVVPSTRAAGPLQIALEALPPGGGTPLRGQVSVVVRAEAMVRSTAAVPARTLSPTAGARPVELAVGVSLGEQGARNALETYRKGLEKTQRDRYDPSARLIFDGISLRPDGADYLATFTQKFVSPRPPGVEPKQRTVRIQVRGNAWAVSSE